MGGLTWVGGYKNSFGLLCNWDGTCLNATWRDGTPITNGLVRTFFNENLMCMSMDLGNRGSPPNCVYSDDDCTSTGYYHSCQVPCKAGE